MEPFFDKYELFAVRNLLIALACFYFYVKKRKHVFLYTSAAMFLYFLIFAVRRDLVSSNSPLIFAALLAAALLLSLKELVFYERQVISFAKFLDFNRSDYIVVGLLMLSYLALKLFS